MPDEPAPAGRLVTSSESKLSDAPEGPDDLALSGAPGMFTPRALASQEAQRRELFEALRTPIITTSMTGRVTGFNAAAIALFGSPARLYGRNIRDVLPFVPEPRDMAGAAEEFPKWIDSAHKVMKGLIRRRNAERELFLSKEVA